MRKGVQIESTGEVELGRRLLWAEALRAGRMAVLWLSLAMLLTALYFVSRSRGSVMSGHLSLIAITLFAALHQAVCLWITRRRLGGIRAASRTVYNYINSFIEVSCVSIAMLILVGSIEPALAMLGVPLLGYFLLLITSSLKLDSPLCVFVGVVAATQYGLVAWLHWDEIVGYYGPGSPIPALGYPMRIGMLLVSGIAAGLVGWLLRRTVIDTVAIATAHAEIVRLFGEHVSPGVVAELTRGQTAIGRKCGHLRSSSRIHADHAVCRNADSQRMRGNFERALVGDGSLRGGERWDHRQVPGRWFPGRLRRPVSIGTTGRSRGGVGA
jgi:hypothetical protein